MELQRDHTQRLYGIYAAGTGNSKNQRKLFKRFIREELKPETFWRRRLKWKNGVPWSHEVCFEFFQRRSDTDETECYWRIAYKGASGFHTFISIEIKEVLQK